MSADRPEIRTPWPDDSTGPVSLLSRSGRSRLRMLEAIAEQTATVKPLTSEQRRVLRKNSRKAVKQ